jgi:hypothetical protein
MRLSIILSKLSHSSCEIPQNIFLSEVDMKNYATESRDKVVDIVSSLMFLTLLYKELEALVGSVRRKSRKLHGSLQILRKV